MTCVSFTSEPGLLVPRHAGMVRGEAAEEVMTGAAGMAQTPVLCHVLCSLGARGGTTRCGSVFSRVSNSAMCVSNAAARSCHSVAARREPDSPHVPLAPAESARLAPGWGRWWSIRGGPRGRESWWVLRHGVATIPAWFSFMCGGTVSSVLVRRGGGSLCGNGMPMWCRSPGSPSPRGRGVAWAPCSWLGPGSGHLRLMTPWRLSCGGRRRRGGPGSVGLSSGGAWSPGGPRSRCFLGWRVALGWCGGRS